MASFNTLCTWKNEQIAATQVRLQCKACGAIRIHTSIAYVKKCPAKILSPCKHFGEYLEEVESKKQCGHRRGTYTCGLHDQCIPFLPTLEKYHCCEQCDDKIKPDC